MTTQVQFDAVRRVMNALRNSLASYLQFARPWTGPTGESISAAIKSVADNHNWYVKRLGKWLIERRGHVVSRSFPAGFTGLNDVSACHALPLVIEDSKRIVHRVESSLYLLRPDCGAYDLVLEICDRERKHLSLLNSLHDDPQADRTAARPHADRVTLASEDSFPASDAPSWTGVAATQGWTGPRRRGRQVPVRAARSRMMLSQT